MNGANSALVIDTRPVWESNTSGLQAPNLSYVAAPLQALRRLPQDQLLKEWFDLRSAEANGGTTVALVATSPASVEALQGMPALWGELAKGLSQKPALFAVGSGSADSLAAWAESCGLDPLVISPPKGSGVEAFLQIFQANTGVPAQHANRLFVLLESTSNQPDLALGLRVRGLRTARFGLYERIDLPLELSLGTTESSLVCVVVSSSALVGPAIAGLQENGFNPKELLWLCHHLKIAQALEKASVYRIHQLADLNPQTIITKVIELSRMND